MGTGCCRGMPEAEGCEDAPGSAVEETSGSPDQGGSGGRAEGSKSLISLSRRARLGDEGVETPSGEPFTRELEGRG